MSNTMTLTDKQNAGLCRLFNAASSLVKTTVGLGNNAAWAACLDAMDYIRRHPRYRQRISGGTTPARQFARAFRMLKQYERQLIYAGEYRFFHVADMSPRTRKAYGPGLTDADYYDFWAAFGFQAYQQTKPFFTSLVNKIRLAYLRHGDPNPEIMGWAVGAQCALDMAAGIWRSAIRSCDKMQLAYTRLSIPANCWAKTFRDFDLKGVADFWKSCVDCLNPQSTFALTATEAANIGQGYEQLAQKWTDTDTIFGSRIKTAADYADIFRTDGEMKKAVRQFAELRDSMAGEGGKVKE